MNTMSKSERSKAQNAKSKQDTSANGVLDAREKSHANSPAHDLNIISINLAIFSLFTALVFSYFVYFSHQLTEVKADILSKILEINAINPPQPWSFLTIPANTEYYYLQRKEILLNEFQNIKTSLQKSNLNESVEVTYGKKMQEIITQIAYFFPFKRMLDFHKDGTVTFDPNNYESIQNTENLNANVPPYTNNGKLPHNYNTEFLKEQIEHINDFHRRFTLELKDGKEKIIEAMTLANGLTKEYDKIRLVKYIESLIEYLGNHHKLAIPLGLTIVKADYIIHKASTKLIVALSFLLAINFLFGVVLPLFVEKFRMGKLFWAIPQIIFVIGISLLFSVSVYSLPI